MVLRISKDVKEVALLMSLQGLSDTTIHQYTGISVLQFGNARPGRPERERAQRMSRRFPRPPESRPRPLAASRTASAVIHFFTVWYLLYVYPISVLFRVVYATSATHHLIPVIGARVPPPTPFPASHHHSTILLYSASIFR